MQTFPLHALLFLIQKALSLGCIHALWTQGNPPEPIPSTVWIIRPQSTEGAANGAGARSHADNDSTAFIPFNPPQRRRPRLLQRGLCWNGLRDSIQLYICPSRDVQVVTLHWPYFLLLSGALSRQSVWNYFIGVILKARFRGFTFVFGVSRHPT